MRYEVNVYFDESGKAQEPLHFMGAASIPKHIHEKHMGQLNSIIKNHDIHWTKYGGNFGTADAIREFIKILLENPFLITVNIITYNVNAIERNAKNIKPYMKDIVDHTVYNKFPERVIYVSFESTAGIRE